MRSGARIFSAGHLETTLSNTYALFGECVRRKMKNAIRRAARRLAAYAREFAPVDTGYLRNSIEANSQSVTVGADYGVFVEYGTSRMPAHPFFTPACELVRAELQKDLMKVLEECRDKKEDDQEGEPDEGAGGAGEGAAEGASEGVAEGAAAVAAEATEGLATLGAEVAAESAELAEFVPLLLL